MIILNVLNCFTSCSITIRQPTAPVLIPLAWPTCCIIRFAFNNVYEYCINFFIVILVKIFPLQLVNINRLKRKRRIVLYL